jgi:hypothetical protein
MSNTRGNLTKCKPDLVVASLAKKLVGKGMGIQEMADRIGIGKTRLRRICSEFGIELNYLGPSLTDAQVLQYIRENVGKCAPETLRKRIGCSYRRVKRIADENGIVMPMTTRRYDIVMIDGFGHKECGKCGELKRVELFWYSAKAKHGVEHKCKECYSRDRREKMGSSNE